MSDRLKELQRQRALAQEQLAWFDREIAAEAGGAPPKAAAPPVAGQPPAPLPTTPQIASPESTPPQAPGDATVAVDKLIAQYQSEPENLHSQVRRGCLLYLVIGFAVVGLGVAVLYYHSTHK